jgi:L-threonylcarbamoyladenylate synthase
MVKLFEEDIVACLEVLHRGGLILYPTDTIWGIGCDATNDEAVEKVYALKMRPKEKNFIVLLADQRDLIRYVPNIDPAVYDYMREQTRPTTIIYPSALGLSSSAMNHNGSVAIRVATDEFCRHLIKRFRKPIISTSANISGSASPARFKEIEKEILAGVNYVVRHRQDSDVPAQPSRIIKWITGEEPVVIRP